MYTDSPHDLPRCYPWSRLIGRLGLWLAGWRRDGSLPNTNKVVLIANPHTSNWDFVLALFAGWAFGLSFNWLGKDKLFKPPLGWLLRILGGVSVDRSKPNGLVDQVRQRFEAADRLMLMVPAAGTRSRREYWKSGFYWMASAADVPIVLGFLDYKTRRAGFGPAMRPSGDVHADMDAIRAFYEGMEGLYPEQQTRIRLRIEDDPDASREG